MSLEGNMQDLIQKYGESVIIVLFGCMILRIFQLILNYVGG